MALRSGLPDPWCVRSLRVPGCSAKSDAENDKRSLCSHDGFHVRYYFRILGRVTRKDPRHLQTLLAQFRIPHFVCRRNQTDGLILMSTNTIRLHRVIRATPEKIYRAFLDPDAMAKWLPPNGFTGKVHQLEAKVGGTYKMSFTNFTTGSSHSFGGNTSS